MRIVKIIAATGVAMSEGVFLRESKREAVAGTKAKAEPKADPKAKAEAPPAKAEAPPAKAEAPPKSEAKDPPKEETPAAKDPPKDETPAAAPANADKCQDAVRQMCNDFDNPDQDAKGLKKKDGDGADKAKTDACTNFDAACDKKKDNAGEGTLDAGKCAEKDKTASFKDAWQVADDFCNGSCGSC